MRRSDAWVERLGSDPRPWLLEDSNPAVRAAALTRLLGKAPDDPDVREARAQAMDTAPIAGILAAQHPDGWWVKPGPGYGPKYAGTVWNLVFLEQLGADPAHPKIQAACRYVLTWCPTSTGGFGCSSSGKEKNPPPSATIHCLNGNIVRALIGFGFLEDPAVQAAVDWTARSITGEEMDRWYASSTSGPGFACGANEKLPCAWGAVKELRGLAAIPAGRRSPRGRHAIEIGIEFLLSRDPATADYPMGYGNTKPNSSWFKLGFPSGYITDVLEVLEVLGELGRADDPRLDSATAWLLEQQSSPGRWLNQYAYNGKTSVDIERRGEPSKWVTLRAAGFLKAALEGRRHPEPNR